MSGKILGAAFLAAALAVVAYGQAIPDDRIVGCYVGTWANYRFGFLEAISPFI